MKERNDDYTDKPKEVKTKVVVAKSADKSKLVKANQFLVQGLTLKYTDEENPYKIKRIFEQAVNEYEQAGNLGAKDKILLAYCYFNLFDKFWFRTELPPIRLNLEHSDSDLERLKKERDILDKAIYFDPTNALAYFWRGQLLNSLSFDPTDHPDSYFRYVPPYERTAQKKAQEKAYLKESMERQGYRVIVNHLDEYLQAKADFEEAMELAHGYTEAQRYLLNAEIIEQYEYYRIESYKNRYAYADKIRYDYSRCLEREADFTKLIELDPRNEHDYHFMLAQNYKMQKTICVFDHDKLNQFDRSSRHMSEQVIFSQLYLNAGLRAFSKKGNASFGKAIEAYSKFIKSDPKNKDLAKTYYNRAICYSELNNHSDSISDLEKSLELQKNSLTKDKYDEFYLDTWEKLIEQYRLRSETHGDNNAKVLNDLTKYLKLQNKKQVDIAYKNKYESLTGRLKEYLETVERVPPRRSSEFRNSMNPVGHVFVERYSLFDSNRIGGTYYTTASQKLAELRYGFVATGAKAEVKQKPSVKDFFKNLLPKKDLEHIVSAKTLLERARRADFKEKLKLYSQAAGCFEGKDLSRTDKILLANILYQRSFYFESKDKDKTIDDLSRSISLSEFKDPLCLIERGKIYMKNFELTEAMIDFDRALATNCSREGLAEIYYLRGESLLMLDNFDQAWQNYEKSKTSRLKMPKNYHNMKAELGLAFVHAKTREAEKAKEIVGRISSLKDKIYKDKIEENLFAYRELSTLECLVNAEIIGASGIVNLDHYKFLYKESKDKASSKEGKTSAVRTRERSFADDTILIRKQRIDLYKRGKYAKLQHDMHKESGEFIEQFGLVKDCEELLKLDPKNIELYKIMAQLYIETNQAPKAIECCDKIIELEPTNLEILKIRARILESLGVDAEIKAYIEVVKSEAKGGKISDVQIDRYKSDRSREGQLRAIAAYSVRIQTDAASGKLYKQRGEIFADAWVSGILSGDKAAGSSPLSIIVKETPYNPLQIIEKAIDDYGLAITLEQKDIEVYKARAGLYIKMGKDGDAILDYTEIIRVDPENIEAYKKRAELYIKNGNIELALEDYSKLIELDPSDKVLYQGKIQQYGAILQPVVASSEQSGEALSSDEVKILRLSLATPLLQKQPVTPLSPMHHGALTRLGAIHSDTLMTLAEAHPETIKYLAQKGLDELLAEQEYRQIKENRHLKEYYDFFCRGLNTVVVGCMAVKSGLVEDDRTSGAEKIMEFAKSNVKIPFVPEIAFDAAGAAIIFVNQRQRTKEVQNITRAFPDLQKATAISEILARHLTLSQKDQIIAAQKVKSEHKDAGSLKEFIDKIKDKAKSALKWITADDVDSPAKEMAAKQAEKLVESIMKNDTAKSLELDNIAELAAIAMGQDKPVSKKQRSVLGKKKKVKTSSDNSSSIAGEEQKTRLSAVSKISIESSSGIPKATTATPPASPSDIGLASTVPLLSLASVQSAEVQQKASIAHDKAQEASLVAEQAGVLAKTASEEAKQLKEKTEILGKESKQISKKLETMAGIEYVEKLEKKQAEALKKQAAEFERKHAEIEASFEEKLRKERSRADEQDRVQKEQKRQIDEQKAQLEALAPFIALSNSVDLGEQMLGGIETPEQAKSFGDKIFRAIERGNIEHSQRIATVEVSVSGLSETVGDHGSRLEDQGSFAEQARKERSKKKSVFGRRK